VENSSRNRPAERGQALIFVTLSLTVLLALIGTVVDVGWAYWRREECQSAANSAALAGATVAYKASNLTCGSGVTCQANTACPASPTGTTDPVQVACQFATRNGFTNGANGGKQSVSIAANITSSPVSGTSPAYWISATVSEDLPLTFLSVLGSQSTTVRVTSTAGRFVQQASGCIYVLDPTADKAWWMTGGNVTTGCGIYVDSSKSDAAYMTGGNLTLNNGADLTIHGSLSQSGGTISPSGDVLQNRPSVSNPFSGMTAPTPVSPCTADPKISGGTSNTINPGTYCGITISGGTNIYFTSGTYILSSGSLTVSGGIFSSTLSDVLIYIPASNSTGTINITGGGMNWTGISGGNTDGFVFWVANSAAQTITGGNYTINGVTYMPSAALSFTGGNGTTQTIVADTISITGGNISNPATSTYFSGGGGVGGVFLMQ
jgi:Flp pilus assembly protein TadG